MKGSITLHIKKKRQHFVWKNYLKPWVVGGSIHCLMNDRIFLSSLSGIAQEKYFYKLIKLGGVEEAVVNEFILSGETLELRKLNGKWIDAFNSIYKVRREAEEKGVSKNKLDHFFDIQKCNFEENLHSRIESSSAKFLNMLYQGDHSFFDDANERSLFIVFLCQQYFRTRSMAERFRQLVGPIENFNVDATWQVLRHVLATTLSARIFLDTARYYPVLMNNKSRISFITGDQPIINPLIGELTLDDFPNSLDDLSSEVELYYPLTPNLALLLTKNFCGEHEINCSEAEATKYNRYIRKQSSKQVYASSRTPLELLLKT